MVGLANKTTALVASHPIISAAVGAGVLILGGFAIYEILQKPNETNPVSNPQQQGGEQSVTPTVSPSSYINPSQVTNPEISTPSTANPSGFGASAGFVGGNFSNEPYFNETYSSNVNESSSENINTYAPVTTTTTTKSLNYAPSLQYAPSSTYSVGSFGTLNLNSAHNNSVPSASAGSNNNNLFSTIWTSMQRVPDSVNSFFNSARTSAPSNNLFGVSNKAAILKATQPQARNTASGHIAIKNGYVQNPFVFGFVK